MNKRRLALVVRKLRSLPPERFDYGSWVGPDWQGAADLSCGTTACALGWATTIPSLAALGLRLVRSRGADSSYVTIGSSRRDDASIRAASEIFDISVADARYLFIPGYCLGESASALEVADHIQAFMDHGWQ